MLIESLIIMQQRAHLTNQEFADKLGIHRVSWQKIKSGKVKFGRKFLSNVRQAFPEMRGDIDIFLSSNASTDNIGETTNNYDTSENTQKRYLGGWGDRVIHFLMSLFSRS